MERGLLVFQRSEHTFDCNFICYVLQNVLSIRLYEDAFFQIEEKSDLLVLD